MKRLKSNLLIAAVSMILIATDFYAIPEAYAEQAAPAMSEEQLVN